MEISEKVAYLKGLAEGLALDTDQGGQAHRCHHRRAGRHG